MDVNVNTCAKISFFSALAEMLHCKVRQEKSDICRKITIKKNNLCGDDARYVFEEIRHSFLFRESSILVFTEHREEPEYVLKDGSIKDECLNF